MREQNKALTLRTRQRLEMSQKLTQEFKARVVISEDDDGHHKGMLRKHARPNLFSLSPEKSISRILSRALFSLVSSSPFFSPVNSLTLRRKGVYICS
jgi:hypothetical protein